MSTYALDGQPLIFQFSRFCTLLLNDDTHSYPEVIDALKKCLRCEFKFAADLTEFIDKEGRAIIKVGSYSVSQSEFIWFSSS